MIRLETRPPNVEGRGDVTIRDLVRNSLRMRPDRIIVGEVRGGEALDMLQAMNTGHDGSLATVHANTADDALSRIETLATMSDVEIPFAAIRDQVNNAIDLVVQLSRHADGTRRITQIAYVVSARREDYRLHTLAEFDPIDAAVRPAPGARRAGRRAGRRRRGRCRPAGRSRPPMTLDLRRAGRLRACC